MTFEPGKSGNPDTQFKPGKSGNPSGLPKGTRSFKVRIRELAEREIDYKDIANKKTRMEMGEALIVSLFGKALFKGDNGAAKILMEYAEDKDLTLKGDPEAPLEIQIDNAKRARKTLNLLAAARKAGLSSEGEMVASSETESDNA
jgi:hypothetical protein